MAKLLVQNTQLVVACGQTAIALDTEDENKCTQLENFNSKDVGCSTEFHIVAGDISGSGKFVVFCTDNKLVKLWKIDADNWKLLSNRISSRVTSKVKFVPSEESVVLADKSGDVYEFSVKCPQQEGKLVLGHLSMLLDIMVTPDGKYVITCDRDEKIRVSCYPNAYNINSYCLGHNEFVTNIFLLPHDKSVLVSTSGDGSMRFWDYVAGVQVHMIEIIADSTLFNYIKNIVEVEENSVLPLRLATSCMINSNCSVVCCCVSKVQGCLIYQVYGTKGNISHRLTQIIKLEAEPWDIVSLDEKLWIVGPVHEEPLCAFAWNSKSCQFVICTEKEILLAIEKVNSKGDLFKNIVITNELTLLFKRKFDNVQEYQKRKKQRLTGLLESSDVNESVQ